MAQVLQLRMPVQALPVDRRDPPQPFLVDFGPFKIIPEVDPQPDPYSYFSTEVDQRVGICPILSAYAVARCFQSGGLF